MLELPISGKPVEFFDHWYGYGAEDPEAYWGRYCFVGNELLLEYASLYIFINRPTFCCAIREELASRFDRSSIHEMVGYDS